MACSVITLQQEIERKCHIPIDKQVLLASGGECLDPHIRVCTYSAGTDTNPVFLFSKSIDPLMQPMHSTNSDYLHEMQERVRETQDLAATYQTVAIRSQIAAHFHDLAKEQTEKCEMLVHEQHLQKQGWSAVIANLEDITMDITKRAEKFEKHYSEYVAEREAYLKLIER